MATIYNSDLSKEILEGARVQLSRDKIPSEIAEKVVPVMEVNPKLLRRCDFIETNSSTTSGTLTITTLPTDKDIFITGFNVNLIKDVANDGATGYLVLTVTQADFGAKGLIRIPIITATAQSFSLSETLREPIKLARGSTITLTGTFTAGVMVRTASIFGYQVANPNA